MGTLPTKELSSPRAELYALIMLAKNYTGDCRVHCGYLLVVQGARLPLSAKSRSSLLDLWVEYHRVVAVPGGSFNVMRIKSHLARAQYQNM
eukprot:7530242-Pyramimonas_sp.AAC.1